MILLRVVLWYFIVVRGASTMFLTSDEIYNFIDHHSHNWSMVCDAACEPGARRERRECAYKGKECLAVLDVHEGLPIPPEAEPGFCGVVVAWFKSRECCWLDDREDDRCFR